MTTHPTYGPNLHGPRLPDEPSDEYLIAICSQFASTFGSRLGLWRVAFSAGRASRDGEVAELQERLSLVEHGAELHSKSLTEELARLRAESMRGAVEKLRGYASDERAEAARGGYSTMTRNAMNERADTADAHADWLEQQSDTPSDFTGACKKLR